MNAETKPSTSIPSPRGVRYSLRFKVLVGLTLFNIAAVGLLTFNQYRFQKERIMAELRDKLADYAYAVNEMLPEGYLDRAVSPDAIPAGEYREVVNKLSRYCNDAGVRYLYTYLKGPKGFYCTSTNGTPEEYAKGNITPYWDLYVQAPPSITQAWETQQPVYAEVADNWGRTYTLFTPMTTAQGTRYIVGSDLTISYIDGLLNESLRRSAILGVITFLFFLGISYPVSTRFSRQIVQLAAYTRELAQANFRPETNSPLRKLITAIPEKTRDEVAELARSFIVMEDQLGSYLHQLQEETAAKERAQNELKIAGEIQLSMLQHDFPTTERVELHAAMKPAKEAGGDFYDFFFLDPDHLGFSIGDVSDKGMPAALFMAGALTTLRAKAVPALVEAPEEILRQTNDLLIQQNQSFQFVTMFLGILDLRNGLITFSDGGHNRPYHRTAAGTATMLTIPPREGIALGVMPGAVFKRHTLQLQRGDAFVLYTDGVTEAIAADESFYREARLQKVLEAIPAGIHAAGWVDAVFKDVTDFSRGHVQADDITVLAVRLPA